MGYWSPSSGNLSATAYLTEKDGTTITNYFAKATATVTVSGNTFTASTPTVTTGGLAGGNAQVDPTSKTVSSPYNGQTVTFELTVNATRPNSQSGQLFSGQDKGTVTFTYIETSSGGDSGDNESGTTTDKCYCGKELVDGKCPDPNCVFREEEDEGSTYYSKWDTSESGLEIIDNYNNTFTIKAKTNYTATYSYPIDSEYDYLRYGFTKGDGAWITAATTNYPYTCTNITNTEDASGISWTSGSGYLSGQPVENAEVTVYAKGWWEPYLSTNGNYYGHVSTTSGKVRYYVAPRFSTEAVPTITTKSSKLTLNKPWTLSWPAALEQNDHSPVKGYKISVRNNADGSAAELISADNNKSLSDYSENGFYFIQGSDLLTVNINPKASGIQPNNEYILYVIPYTQFGADNTGDVYPGDSIQSIVYTAENNGVLHVRVGNEWKEGQVYVMTDKGWKESEGIYVKTAKGWKESQ